MKSTQPPAGQISAAHRPSGAFADKAGKVSCVPHCGACMTCECGALNLRWRGVR